MALCVLVLCASCDMMGKLSGLIPKISTDPPNLLVGTWKVIDTNTNTYSKQLVLDTTGKYSYTDTTASTTVEGSYSVSYDHLDLLQASGEITFSKGFDGHESAKTFSFVADKDDGPQSLKINNEDAFVFISR